MMEYKNLFYKANSIRKYFRNISLAEAKKLGLENIILELTLRKKPLDKDEQYSVYLFEYFERTPLDWNTDSYEKSVLQKNYFITIIQYKENTDLITAIKTRRVKKYEVS